MIFLNILIVLAAFLGMEFMAWFSHKYIMHGLLWHLHRDHHEPHKNQRFEKNDLFFLIFAAPAIVCFYIGVPDLSAPFWIAVGITLYGIAYFFVHDVFIHRRAKIFRNTNSPYLRAIRKAHKVHHKHLSRYPGECFGMLWAPLKYFKEARRHAD